MFEEETRMQTNIARWTGISTFLLGIFLVVPSAVHGERGSSATATTGNCELVIATEPRGAGVYLDGEFAGRTPVTLNNVATGVHRVRLVKDGFLENARNVNVGVERRVNIDIGLTPARNSAPSMQVSSTGGGGSGGSRKWIWIGIAGGGTAAVITAVALTKNNLPTGALVPGTVAVSPDNITGLAAATSYTFSAQGASDPGNKALTFNWSFGDGSTGSGASITHTYQSAGSFTIGLTVSNGQATANATSSSVTVKDLSGQWTGNLGSNSLNLTITQNGSALGGSGIFAGNIGSLSGAVVPQRVVTLNLNVGGTSVPIVLSGTVDSTVSTVSGTVTSGLSGVATFSFHR
jgi:PKD domain-containing protein/PEGA domain-containing protein